MAFLISLHQVASRQHTIVRADSSNRPCETWVGINLRLVVSCAALVSRSRRHTAAWRSRSPPVIHCFLPRVLKFIQSTDPKHLPPSPLNTGIAPKAVPATLPATAAAAKRSSIPAVLGANTIPDPLDKAAAQEALKYFLAAGFDEIDTAILYQEGATTATLGTQSRTTGPQDDCRN